MIKLMREGARKYPWLLKSIMGVLAVAFIITMGWWGFGEGQTNAVASVGDITITRDEFRRAYENTSRFYRDNIQGEFHDEQIKQFVIDNLIEGKLWTLAAKEMALTITAEELRDDIMKRQEFQKDGKFDPDLYRQLLAANRLTPSQFETFHTAELLREKAKALVRDAVALTPSEIAEAQSLGARQAQAEAADQSAQQRLVQSVLFQKQQRALLAYTQSFKTQVPVHVHKENL